MVGDQQDRLAGPAGSVGSRRHGQQLGAHPRDHGPVDGGPDPSLQARHRGVPGAGRAGLLRRSSRPAASSASTSSPTAAPARYRAHFREPSPSSTCRPMAAMCEGGHDRRRHRRGGLPRPRDGWSRPLSADAQLTDLGHRPGHASRPTPKAIVARYPQSRAPRCSRCCTSCSREEGLRQPATASAFCAGVLDLTTAEVAAVATFYTMYKRHPVWPPTSVGVCTNTLCAVLGGDEIFDAGSRRAPRRSATTRPPPTAPSPWSGSSATRPASYAPVRRWSTGSSSTTRHPRAARDLTDRSAGRRGRSRPPVGRGRCAPSGQMSRVLAGFDDGRAGEGVGAGPATLRGTLLARERRVGAGRRLPRPGAQRRRSVGGG